MEESKPRIKTSDAVLKIGKMKVRFHGGARYFKTIPISLHLDLIGPLLREQDWVGNLFFS